MFSEEYIIVIPSVLFVFIFLYHNNNSYNLLRTPNTLDAINSRVNLYTFISHVYCCNVRSHFSFFIVN